jgi:cellulose 1,4-beta-cellobiosidase
LLATLSTLGCSADGGSADGSGVGGNAGSGATFGSGATSGTGANIGSGATPGSGATGPNGGGGGNAGTFTGSGATGNGATGSGATGSGATGSGATGSGATGNGTAGTGSGGNGTAGNGASGTGQGGNGTGATGTGGTGNAGTTGSGGTPPGNVQHVENPYAGAKGYVNPEWQAKAKAETGGDRVANTPTAVWLDRIAAINGSTMTMGLKAHLDAALAQSAGYVQFVIYDLPGRDCSALASNGELSATDLPRYKSEYIDPIAAIEGDAKYQSIHVVNIIEPDSLPNLVTNTSVAQCATMKSNGGYVQGVAYALQKLGAIPNVYNYLDAGHHGWLGWDSNMGPTVDIFAQTATMAGIKTVTGFITNTANYSALKEAYFDINTMVNGTSVKQAKWVDFNNYVDESTFSQGLRQKLVAAGFDSKIGMLIDTSRNGWGGSARPAAASTATDVDTFVNQSRLDRRIHAGNWCNQSGAGLGERPRASPADGIHAYVWIKPPGESDGSSTMIQNNDGKGFDRMCDPTYTGNERNGNSMTGSLANAPLSGAWFSAQFQELMKNAYPAL